MASRTASARSSSRWPLNSGRRRSATSAMFSITVLVWAMLGPVTGHLSDRFGPRIVVAFRCARHGTRPHPYLDDRSLWLGYLTYGIGVGVGVACAYVPMVAVSADGSPPAQHRTRNRGGRNRFRHRMRRADRRPCLMRRWVGRATYVVFAIATTAILLDAPTLPSARRSTSQPSPLRLAEAIRTPAFGLMYGVVGLLISTALFVPFVICRRSRTIEECTEFLSAALVGIIGGASVAGRMGLGALCRSRRSRPALPGEFFSARAQLQHLDGCEFVSTMVWCSRS